MKKKLLNLKKIGFTLIASILINSVSSGANFTAVVSGDWSSSLTWGGTAPSFTNLTDVVTIPAGIDVTLDNNLTIFGATAEVNVMGTLSSTTYAITNALGYVSGTGTINIADFYLQTTGLLTFTGNLTADNFTYATINAPISASITVNKTLTLKSGTLSLQTGGTLVMASNSTVVVNDGLLAINGGSLSLTNNYNVIYNSSSNTTAGLELYGSGLKNVTIDLPSPSNSILLSADLTLNGTLTLTKGTFALGVSNLTINGDVVANGNGKIASTMACNITLNSPNGITGSLNFRNSNDAVNNLTLNIGASNQAKIMGTITVNGSLNLTSGTLVLDSTYLRLKGNISAAGTGTIFSDISSTIDVNTLNPPVGAIRFSPSCAVKAFKVNITGDGSLKLESDLTIRDSLSLAKGTIDIGNNHIMMDASGIITGAKVDAYIITGATGYVSMMLTAGGSAKLFPVGTATSYLPANILLNPASSSGTVKVGVIQNVYAMGTTGTDWSTTKHVVDATWMVQSDITTALDLNMNLMWSASDEVNGFNRNVAYISHFTNASWDVNISSSATLNTNGMYSLSRNNISALSPFAVFDNIASQIITGPLANNGISIFPNPASDRIWINNISGNDEIINVDIMDVNGKIVASQILTKDNNCIALDGLIPGCYFVKLHNETSNIVNKIIKI